MKTHHLGRFLGLDISFLPSAVAGFGGLWIGITLLAGLWLRLPWGAALLFGLAASVLHEVSDLIHQLGHAVAARRTGYPMAGICFWGIFSAGQYPTNEPALPGGIHIRRALGGPAASALVSLLTGLLALLLPAGSAVWLLAWFVFLDNLLVLTLQMFIPLGFNDGGTLLYWLRH